MRSDFSLASDVIVCGAFIAEFLILAHTQRIGSVLGVMDHPDHIRKRHPQVTPLVGGLAIMAALLIWTTATFILGTVSNDRLELKILLCGPGATLLGHSDNQSSTSPSSRLLSLLLLTAMALVIAPMLLPTRLILGFAPSLSLAPWVAYGLVTIAMAGFVNAVNMADGQNGHGLREIDDQPGHERPGAIRWRQKSLSSPAAVSCRAKQRSNYLSHSGRHAIADRHLLSAIVDSLLARPVRILWWVSLGLTLSSSTKRENCHSDMAKRSLVSLLTADLA